MTNNTDTANAPVINATHPRATTDDFDITLNARALKLLQMVLEEKHCEVIRLDNHRRGLQASHPRATAAREVAPNGTVTERAQRGTADNKRSAATAERGAGERSLPEPHHRHDRQLAPTRCVAGSDIHTLRTPLRLPLDRH